MASYNELNALIDAYIYRNGVQAITGQILNGVLKAMVEQLGRGYTIMGAATPATDPGTPDSPESWFASEAGTYTDFDGLQIVTGELALLCYTPSGGWTKETIYEGFQEVEATIDGNVGTPSVGVSYANGVLSFAFRNMKGQTGATGETGPVGPAGVTSVAVTVDNTTGTPTATASLVNGVLTIAFSGLKGAQGNTGSSVDYPFTIVNNLTTDDAAQALSAAMGVQLEGEITQLEREVDEVDGLRVSTSPVDLSFEDGDGNVLVKFSDGHIEVENFNSKDVSDLSTDTTGEADLEFADADGNAIVRFIDGHIKTKNFDSSAIENKKPYARETYFKTKVDCVQMNASSFTATNPNDYVSQVLYQDNCVLLLPDSYTPGGKPTRLIIFCKQGNNQITDSSNPILTSNAMGNIFHFLLARGYAVLGADGVPDGLSTALGLDDTRVSGSYAAVQSTREAYDYVVENYNIDTTGAFIFGYSQGGIYAQNVIDLAGIPIIGCAMVSPTVSMRFHLWDLSSTKEIGGVTWTKTSRLNIARLYGFDEVETDAELLALQFNREKVAGYDPWFRNVENPYEGFTQTSAYGSNLWALPSGTSIDAVTMKKKIGCPTKIWAAENDSTLGTDVTKVFVKACRNAGQVCDLHLYNNGNHHIFQSTYQSPAISTFSDQGNTYNLYPIAYEIASFFYRCGGLSLTD